MSSFIVQMLLVLTILIGNVSKFSFFSQDVHVSVLDCIVFILTLIMFIFERDKFTKTIGENKKITQPLLIFSVVGIISLILTQNMFGYSAVVVGSMYLVRWTLYSLFFVTIVHLIKSREILKFLYIIGLTVVVSGIGQYIIHPDIRNLQVAEWDMHYYRLVGTLLDPGFMGIILVFTLILLTLRPLKNSRLNFLLWGSTYAAFALTYSRSSYLAYLVAMGYVSLQLKSKKFMVLILLLFGLTVVVLPRAPDGEGVKLERTNSIQARIDNWRHAWNIFLDNPFMGVGFNTYRYAQNKYGYLTDTKWLKSHAGAGADSSLLFVAATTGAVGLGVYLWYLSALWRLKFMRPFLVAVLVHSLFLNSLFYPFVLLWLAGLTGYTLQSSPSEPDSQPGR